MFAMVTMFGGPVVKADEAVFRIRLASAGSCTTTQGGYSGCQHHTSLGAGLVRQPLHLVTPILQSTEPLTWEARSRMWLAGEHYGYPVEGPVLIDAAPLAVPAVAGVGLCPDHLAGAGGQVLIKTARSLGVVGRILVHGRGERKFCSGSPLDVTCMRSSRPPASPTSVLMSIWRTAPARAVDRRNGTRNLRSPTPLLSRLRGAASSARVLQAGYCMPPRSHGLLASH